MGRNWRDLFESQAGFSLVELMVVVTLSGIVAVAAVPNYIRYSNRSAQSEAKSTLSMLYAMERNYAADFGSFTACISKIGFSRSENDQNFYTVGFKPTNMPSTCGPDGDEPCNRFHFEAERKNPDGTNAGTPESCTQVSDVIMVANSKKPAIPFSGAPATIPDTTAFDLPSAAAAPSIDRTTFMIRAAGNLGMSSGPLQYDYWSIDQDKVLRQDAVGI